MHITARQTMAINTNGGNVRALASFRQNYHFRCTHEIIWIARKNPIFVSAGIENASVNTSVDLDWQRFCLGSANLLTHLKWKNFLVEKS